MKWINQIKSNKFSRSVLLIAGGTAFAQIFHIAMSPIITRIYSPEEYGILTAYLTIVSILSLGAFKYEVCIPISENDETAINVLALSIGLIGIYTFVISIFLWNLGEWLLNFFDSKILMGYMFFIPIGIALSGLYKVLRQWALRSGNFNTIARTSVNQSIFGDLFKIILGVIKMGATGLIIGGIIRESAGITVLAKPLLSKNKELIKKVSLAQICWSAKRYKDFPLFNLPTHFISTLSGKLPIIFLTMIYGIHIVGFYGLAESIVRLPMKLIGNSVGDVFYSEAASFGRNQPIRLKNLSNKIIKKLCLIGLIPLLIFLTIGPTLFGIVFGRQWLEAGIYARITSVMVFFILIFAPVSRVYEVFEKQRMRLIIDISKFSAVILVFGLSWIFKFSSYVAVILYSIVISMIHFFIYIFAQRIMNEAIKGSTPDL